MRDFLHVQDADDVVEIALADRQPRVRRRAQRVEDRVPVVADVDVRDLAARDHDVVDPDRLQAEHLVGELRAIGGGRRIVRRASRAGAARACARAERESEQRAGQRSDDGDQGESRCGEREQVRGP